jgi:hypothetical protein
MFLPEHINYQCKTTRTLVFQPFCCCQRLQTGGVKCVCVCVCELHGAGSFWIQQSFSYSEISAFYVTWRFIVNSLWVVPWATRVQSAQAQPVSLEPLLMLSFHYTGFSQVAPSLFKFFDRFVVSTLPRWYACYVTRLSHSPWYADRISILRTVQIRSFSYAVFSILQSFFPS